MKKIIAATMTLYLLISVVGCSKKKETPIDLSGVFYSHGEDGYFSMLDEGYVIPIRDQGPPGACVAYASAAAIQRSILYINGEDFDIDPVDLIIDSCSADHEEGLIISNENGYATAYSASPAMEWATADGYDGYYLIESPSYYGIEQEDLSRETIKEAIRTYGGVTAGLLISTPKYMGWHGGYYTYFDDSSRGDHEVTVIGYDDHFPKELFGDYATEDGAWLIQNSFGEAWGSSGYFWASYESNIRFLDAYELTDEYSEVISYSVGAYNCCFAGDNPTIASVYENTGTIGGVGTYVGWYYQDDGSMMMASDSCSITVEIRSSDFSELLYSQDATFDMSGYYVVKLDEAIEVDGQFAVVITYHGENMAIPVEGASGSIYLPGIQYVTSMEEGQSYIYYDNQWLDMYDSSNIEYIINDLYTEGNMPPLAEGNDLEEAIAEAIAEPSGNPYVNVLFI